MRTIAIVEAEREALFKLKEPIDAKLTKLYHELERLKKKQDEAAEFSVEWMMTKAMDTSIAYERSTKWAMSHYLYRTGRWTNTNQIAFSLIMKANKPDQVALVKEGIKQLMPFYTPVDTHVLFDISTPDHSASGILHLAILPDMSAAEIRKTTYGHTKVLHTGTLDEMLETISKRFLNEDDDDD